MLSTSIKSKHLRCLAVVADTVTSHARRSIFYTPDVQLTQTEQQDKPISKGTERWEIPREPSGDGTISFTGDCEDFAREVYQQCKEIREWIKPESDSLMGQLSTVLHMYVPTIDQGAVDSSAHSKYITYDAPYRNHIWAALHPRQAWRTKMYGKCSLEALYTKFPEQKCEKTLPLLHLEGTGDVYPVVTNRKPGYIAKMKMKMRQVRQDHPFVIGAETPDMSLQCDHRSTFYKYAIAFMTDIFEEQGMLDYTYVTQKKYGVSIYDWTRGKYSFKPSTCHTAKTMARIHSMIRCERPVLPIINESIVVKRPVISPGYFLRFGQRERFEKEHSNVAEYKIGDKSWHEAYFKVGDSQESSSEIDS